MFLCAGWSFLVGEFTSIYLSSKFITSGNETCMYCTRGVLLYKMGSTVYLCVVTERSVAGWHGGGTEERDPAAGSEWGCSRVLRLHGASSSYRLRPNAHPLLIQTFCHVLCSQLYRDRTNSGVCSLSYMLSLFIAADICGMLLYTGLLNLFHF